MVRFKVERDAVTALEFFAFLSVGLGLLSGWLGLYYASALLIGTGTGILSLYYIGWRFIALSYINEEKTKADAVNVQMLEEEESVDSQIDNPVLAEEEKTKVDASTTPEQETEEAPVDNQAANLALAEEQ